MGNVLTSGKKLWHTTGTERNYGLNKIMYKHEMPKNEVTQIPKYIRNNTPIEITSRGQKIYAVLEPDGEIRIVTTPRAIGETISSMYFKTK